MYRIPYGKGQQPGPRPVVLLHHGITLSSACFTLLNTNESMAYVFADAGYDVWMANTRGNTFSRGNLQYSYRQPEYWQHTIDQYALVDAPAQIDKALEVSGAKKLAFVGHSQGSSIVYALLSAKPEYNDKMSVVLHMGPVVFIKYLQAQTVRGLAEAGNDNVSAAAAVVERQAMALCFVQQLFLQNVVDPPAYTYPRLEAPDFATVLTIIVCLPAQTQHSVAWAHVHM